MNTTHQTQSSHPSSPENESPYAFYLLMAALIGGLVLVVLLPFFL